MPQKASTPTQAALIAAAQAERFGFPTVDGDRATLIAALHTVINWLINHPGIPVPQLIELTFFPRAGARPQTADLLALAEQLDGRISAAGQSQWTEAGIPLDKDAGGLQARYVVYGVDNQPQ